MRPDPTLAMLVALVVLAALAGCNADRNATAETDAAPLPESTPAVDTDTAPVDVAGAAPPGAELPPTTPPLDPVSAAPDGDTTVAGPAGPAAPTAAVPSQLQGSYALNQQACTQPGHESHLTLTGDRIQLHESRGAITQARMEGDTLHLTANLTGEGETRQATYRFVRTDNGLRDVDHGMVRVRCP